MKKHSSHKVQYTSNYLHLRYAICYHYTTNIDAPHEDHWDGINSMVSQIRKDLYLHLSQTRTIKKTLKDIASCTAIVVEIDGKKYNRFETRHINSKLDGTTLWVQNDRHSCE